MINIQTKVSKGNIIHYLLQVSPTSFIPSLVHQVFAENFPGLGTILGARDIAVNEIKCLISEVYNHGDGNTINQWLTQHQEEFCHEDPPSRTGAGHPGECPVDEMLKSHHDERERSEQETWWNGENQEGGLVHAKSILYNKYVCAKRILIMSRVLNVKFIRLATNCFPLNGTMNMSLKVSYLGISKYILWYVSNIS